ncbi:MAG: chromosomal replication initiator protein DnaA, partial [Burkholderiales bacterium]
MVEIDIIWQQCLILLKDQFGEQDYNTWFRLLKAKYENDKLQIVASNRLVQDFIKNKYWDRISNILAELTGGIQSELVVGANTQQKFVPLSTTENTADTLSPSNSASVITMPSKSKAKIDKEVLATLQQATKLNPNYIFESLVRGNSNQLAYAIGMHVTQKPGNKNHNPLFIYGGVGLGKTHLMQAIGNEIHNKNPKAKIRYLHANDYIQDVVKASMRQGFDELKKYYNSLDLLLMDDIQFIAGDKTKTQEEFFYTFNTLLDKGKQVIMTCDTYPKNINNLNERLISRFASGLTVEIQPPELEMRVAILKRKAEQNRLNLEDDVAFFIAQNIKSNVRELEGALNKVLYQAQFSGKGISLAIAKEALMDILAM